MRFYSINSNLFSLSIFSPLMDERVTADWHIFSFLPISMVVVIQSFRCAQKHKRLRALTVGGDFPKAITCSLSMPITSTTRCITRLKS